DGAFEALRTNKINLDLLLRQAERNELFAGRSLTKALQAYQSNMTFYAKGAFDKVEMANRRALSQHPEHPVFTNIALRLGAERTNLNKSVRSLVLARE